MPNMSRSIRCDLSLAILFMFSLLLIVFIFADGSHRLYSLTVITVALSLVHAYTCRAYKRAPFANDFLAIAFAAMGALLFHEVQETERDKLALVTEYSAIKDSINVKKIAARDFAELLQVLPNVRAYILEWLKDSQNMRQVETVDCQLIVVPPRLTMEDYLGDGSFGDDYKRTYRLDEFVLQKEMVCTPNKKMVVLPDYDITDSTHELIDHAVQRGHSYLVMIEGREYPLNALKEMSLINASDGLYEEKLEQLEESVRVDEESLSNIERKYTNLSSIDAYDISAWRTKNFYSSWWSMLLIVSICYQLNSSVIFYQSRRSEI